MRVRGQVTVRSVWLLDRVALEHVATCLSLVKGPCIVMHDQRAFRLLPPGGARGLGTRKRAVPNHTENHLSYAARAASGPGGGVDMGNREESDESEEEYDAWRTYYQIYDNNFDYDL